MVLFDERAMKFCIHLVMIIKVTAISKNIQMTNLSGKGNYTRQLQSGEVDADSYRWEFPIPLNQSYCLLVRLMENNHLSRDGDGYVLNALVSLPGRPVFHVSRWEAPYCAFIVSNDSSCNQELTTQKYPKCTGTIWSVVKNPKLTFLRLWTKSNFPMKLTFEYEYVNCSSDSELPTSTESAATAAVTEKQLVTTIQPQQLNSSSSTATISYGNQQSMAPDSTTYIAIIAALSTLLVATCLALALTFRKPKKKDHELRKISSTIGSGNHQTTQNRREESQPSNTAEVIYVNVNKSVPDAVVQR